MHSTRKPCLQTATLTLFIALGATFGTTPRASVAQTNAPPAAAAATTKNSGAAVYTRALKGADGSTTGVQTAIRTFVRGDSGDGGSGPTVHLVAVTHIGEAAYYQELQTFLDTRKVVLYEGVKMSAADAAAAAGAKAAAPAKPPAATGAGKPAAATAGSPVALQQRLSRALGVQFQLEAIDYKRPHFRNSDLSWQEMERLAGQSGEATTQQLSQMRSMLSGAGSAPGGSAALVAGLMGQVETNPAVALMFRRLLVTTLSDPDALARLQAQAAAGAATGRDAGAGKAATPPPSSTPGSLNQILIAERNRAVLKDLAAILPGLGRESSVALFYGAAHMADLEQRLVRELGYREATDAPPRWLTALLAAPPSPKTTAPAP